MRSLAGLCPDWEDLDPKNAKTNAKEAMDAAEQWLNVPQVLNALSNLQFHGIIIISYLVLNIVNKLIILFILSYIRLHTCRGL